MHRLLIEHLGDLETTTGGGSSPTPLTIDGDEARHALAVKRVRPGEAVGLFDGAGHVAEATVVNNTLSWTKPSKHRDQLHLEVGEIRYTSPIQPSVTVCSATPKGQRVDEMVEGLSQAGAAAWRPMRTARGVVDPREAKLERLGRISRESAKQCGRAWIMRVEPELTFDGALAAFPLVLVADATGASVLDGPMRERIRAAERVGLLVGPEGGFAPEELELARQRGAAVVRLGPLVMRIETAAAVGAAMVIEAGR